SGSDPPARAVRDSPKVVHVHPRALRRVLAALLRAQGAPLRRTDRGRARGRRRGARGRSRRARGARAAQAQARPVAALEARLEPRFKSRRANLKSSQAPRAGRSARARMYSLSFKGAAERVRLVI